jgi:FixJ family two-component response regulator
LIAVVEDDPSMRKAIHRIVRGQGLSARTYESAEALLDDRAEDDVVCLILDIQLGGMSGLDLTRQRAGVPVIFVTALEDDGVQREAEELGCVAYLRKPFEAAALIAAIRRALALS